MFTVTFDGRTVTVSRDVIDRQIAKSREILADPRWDAEYKAKHQTILDVMEAALARGADA